MEGTRPFSEGNRGNLTPPIYEYNHTSGNCSVTGGYVYRGSDIKALRGVYFFADYCSGRVWSFVYNNGSITGFTDWSDKLRKPDGAKLRLISSFGRDTRGELYICELEEGNVYKIIAK